MKNPNAVIGGTSGLGGGAALVFVLSLVGVHVSNYVGVFVASAIAAAVLWVGRVEKAGGIAGAWRKLMHGTTPAPPAPKP